MAAIWTEDVLTIPGKQATRGFGGRIYFYNEKGQAVPVEGELIVHGYDEGEKVDPQTGASDDSASKKFKFTSEQFTQHFSQSELGASYSVWIPWDAHGGFQKKVMLLPSFITKDGKMIRGNAAKVTLAGKSPTGLASYPANTVSQVSANIPTVEAPLPRLSEADVESMRTTTIQIPTASSRRWTGASVAPNSGNTGSPINVSEGPGNIVYGNGLNPQQIQNMMNPNAMMQNAMMQNAGLNTSGMANVNNVQQRIQQVNTMQNMLNDIQAASAQTTIGLNPAFAPSQNGNNSSVTPASYPPPGSLLRGNVPSGANPIQGFQSGSMPVQTMNSSTSGFATQPMPSPGAMSPTSSGFPNPGFPQLDWSKQLSHFGPNQSPAPIQQAAPSASYQPR